MSLLERLESRKGSFGPAAAREVAALLIQAKRTRFRDPADLIRLHETVLFLRAYPQSPRVLRLADEVLFAFDRRIRRDTPEPLAAGAFEDPEISGIAGTALATTFSYPFAKSLAARHGDSIRVDWDAYGHPERLAYTLARRIPEAFEDWAIEPHADWRRWYESAGGTAARLIEGVDPQVYDLWELPLRWALGRSEASRSRTRISARKIFYHDAPFLTRRDVSIAAELAAPPLRATKLAAPRARKMLDLMVDASAVRYRELYGFIYPDARMFHAPLGRGVDVYFCGVHRRWRLPRREYCAGMYFKNGVPIGYVEVMWIGVRMEVGFNLYYTFRQGETAWLYARLLKLFRQQYGVTQFFIPPYQLGHENEEAIESGAFWFYHKLGFRSESRAVEKMTKREEEKLAARPGYRTPPRILRKLAAAPLVLDI